MNTMNTKKLVITIASIFFFLAVSLDANAAEKSFAARTWNRVVSTVNKMKVAAVKRMENRKVVLVPGAMASGWAGNVYIVETVARAKTPKVKAPQAKIVKDEQPMKIFPGPTYGYAGNIYIP
jgi:hypothetical protein